MQEQKKFNLICALWLVLLTIFTLWCIYNLYKNYKLPDLRKFGDIPISTGATIISYLNNIKTKDKITDINGCENVYDDNVKVRELGYNSCANAYADYVNNSLDPEQKYGGTKSLEEICPVSSKSPKYMDCMMKLITKFDTNSNILENINGEMNNIIDARLINRNTVLNNIGIDMNAYLNSDIQREFNNMQLLRDNNLNLTLDEQLRNANNFYKDRTGISVNVFSDIPNDSEKVIVNSEPILSTIEMDPYFQKVFFGDYTAVPGQYLAFNNLLVTLDYESLPENTPIDSRIPNPGDADFPLGTPGEISFNGVPTGRKVKRIFFKITDLNTDANVVYTVSNLNTPVGNKNIIQLTLFNEIITANTPGDSTAMFQLLKLLGVNKNNRVFISADKFTSTENISHITYKLTDFYNNTIMIMYKVRSVE